MSKISKIKGFLFSALLTVLAIWAFLGVAAAIIVAVVLLLPAIVIASLMQGPESM